jgi:predicted metal-dependent hydrolase
VSGKDKRIVDATRHFTRGKFDPHFTGFFELFNQRKFFEAHEVLEDLWLADKQGPNGNFYKGLIQLAGAFVHLQKNRPQPAMALFKLALANLKKYPRVHEQLDLDAVCGSIQKWLEDLEQTINLLTAENSPELKLEAGGS